MWLYFSYSAFGLNFLLATTHEVNNSKVISFTTLKDVHQGTNLCLHVGLQVILTEVYSIGFQRSFFDEDDLTSIAENDVIYAFQAPPLYIRGGSARISGMTEASQFLI